MSIRMKGGHVVRTDGILNAEDLAPALDATTFREWLVKVHAKSRVAKLIMDGKLIRFEPKGPAVEAEIEYGRWIATCPDCGETAVENVTPNDPIFFCFNCCNVYNEFHVRPVKFPSQDDRDLIAAALGRREHKDMYWRKNESAHDLDIQNAHLADQGKLRK